MDARPIADSPTESNECDLCGSQSARELYTASDRLRNSDMLFSISMCDGCGVLRTLPEMSERELSRYYPNDYWGDRDPPSLEWIKSSQREKTGFLRKCGLRGGRILDVGCGAGLFLRALDGQSWERFGIENGPNASALASRELGAGHIFNSTLLEARLVSGRFDAITFWSALEHLNHPRSNLLEAKRLIKPGGTIIVQVPNAASYQAHLFGKDWFALDAPRHRYHFSLAMLESLLADAGFKVYRATYFSRAHNAHAFRQSLKTRLRAATSRAGWAAFCLTIPLIRPIDFLLTAMGGGATVTVAARAI
jgi:2-polyprenyl-3-methyl-5-hydroxy-6-metoxy-1,4-benzoquinol methylase